MIESIDQAEIRFEHPVWWVSNLIVRSDFPRIEDENVSTHNKRHKTHEEKVIVLLVSNDI